MADMVRLRKRLYKVHSWTGVLVGLFIYVVSFSGTTALFRDELYRWQNVSARRAMPAEMTIDAIVRSEIVGVAPEHGLLLSLPNPRRPLLEVFYEVEGTDHHHHLVHKVYDLDTGREITEAHEGVGDFLRDLHTDLHVEGNLGGYAVGIAGLLAMLGIVTGVIIHARFFRDFFTFRGAGSSSIRWLDAHNVLGVWLLPFHAMMTFTGALLGLAGFFITVLSFVAFDGDVEKAAASILGATPSVSGRAAVMADVDVVVRDLRAREPSGDALFLMLNHWDDENAYAVGFVEHSENLNSRREHVYRLTDGAYLERRSIGDSPAGRVYAATIPLHFGTFGGVGLKLLYALLGLGTSVLVASGLMVWLERHRLRYPHAQQWLERLVPGFTTGMGVATAAALVTQHLLPNDDALVFRLGVVYFASWAATIVCGLSISDARRATRLGLLATGVVLMLAPCVQALATGDSLVRAAARGEWFVAGVDAVLVAIAAAAIATAVRLRGTTAAAAPVPDVAVVRSGGGSFPAR